MPQKAFIFLSNMAASESRDLVVMETGLKITTYSMINILWKFKWLWFKSLEDISFLSVEPCLNNAAEFRGWSLFWAAWYFSRGQEMLALGTRLNKTMPNGSCRALFYLVEKVFYFTQ